MKALNRQLLLPLFIGKTKSLSVQCQQHNVNNMRAIRSVGN